MCVCVSVYVCVCVCVCVERRGHAVDANFPEKRPWVSLGVTGFHSLSLGCSSQARWDTCEV